LLVHYRCVRFFPHFLSYQADLLSLLTNIVFRFVLTLTGLCELSFVVLISNEHSAVFCSVLFITYRQLSIIFVLVIYILHTRTCAHKHSRKSRDFTALVFLLLITFFFHYWPVAVKVSLTLGIMSGLSRPCASRVTRIPGTVALRCFAYPLPARPTCTPPALKNLYAIRAYTAPELITVSPPSQLSTALVSFADNVATAVTRRNSPAATQLTTLPTTLLTQVVLWQRTRAYCAAATVAAVEEGPPRLLRRTEWRGEQTALQLGLLQRHMIGGVASTSAQAATRPRCIFVSSLEGEKDVSEATRPRTPSASATPTTATTPLHTSRRYYGSTAVHAPAQDDGHTGDDAALCALPRFREICAAFHVLRLVDADGRVVRRWTAADIKRAYRALAKELHPDVAGGDNAHMEQINAAYACLASLPDSLVTNYQNWLDGGGEAELLEQDAQAVRGLLRWVSKDVVQLMLVGWCTTFSGLAMYASWRLLHGPVSASAVTCHTGSVMRGATVDTGVASGRLTLLRAGAAMASAPGVQYGVVSSGGALFFSSGLSLHGLKRWRAAVSRYALAVALTVAACVNTLMLQRVLTRIVMGRV
jgi:hypothetical protein